MTLVSEPFSSELPFSQTVSYCYQLPGITLPFPVRERAEHQTTFSMLEEQKFALVQYLASLANLMDGIHSAIQFTSITSIKHRAHMQVSNSDHCERTILSTVFILVKKPDRWRVSPLQCWKLRKLELGRHLRPCVGKSYTCWCCCVTGFQESYCYQLPGITLPFPVREWAEHQTTFAMLGEQQLALVQYLASLANSMGIRAAIQFTSITSPKHRAHMQVSNSDHCERTILSTVFILVKKPDRWRVSPLQCWKLRKLELGRHLRPCVGKTYTCWCCCVTGFQESYCYQLPGITLPFPVRDEPSIKQLLPCWKIKNLPSFNILPVLLIQWAFEQQSNSHQSPVPNIEHTCRCQAMTTVTEPFSPLFLFLQRVSRSMKSVSFAMLKAEKAWAWQTPQTLCWEELYLLMLLCDRLPGILLLPATRNHVAFSGSRMSRASNNFCHAGRTKICPRAISCQSC